MARKNVTAVECSRCHGVSYLPHDVAPNPEYAVEVKLAGKNALVFEDLCERCLGTVRKAVDALTAPLERKKRGPRKAPTPASPTPPPTPPVPPKAPKG